MTNVEKFNQTIAKSSEKRIYAVANGFKENAKQVINVLKEVGGKNERKLQGDVADNVYYINNESVIDHVPVDSEAGQYITKVCDNAFDFRY